MHNDATKTKIKEQESHNREGKNSTRKLPNTAKEYNKEANMELSLSADDWKKTDIV